MRSVRARQIAGVTSLVGFIVLMLTLLQLNAVARISLDETGSRAKMLANSIYQSAFVALSEPARDADALDPSGGQLNPREALRSDNGIRSNLESAIGYSDDVTYAAIVDSEGVVVAHSSPELEGTRMSPQPPFSELVGHGPFTRIRTIYSDATNYEIRQALLVGDREWSVRIGVSTLLIKDQLEDTFRDAITTALIALVLALLFSPLLTRWMLRPIH